MNNSPLLPLEQAIFDSAIRVAPERETELDEPMARRNVQFYVDRNSNPIVLGSFPATGDIILGLRGLERLWAHAHAYWCVYQVAAAARRQDPSATELCLTSDSRTASARELLLWALNEEVKAVRDTSAPAAPWPAATPRPGSGAHGSDVHVTDEIFLCATGAIIHHELGHVELEHGDCAGPLALQEEFDADAHAANWILTRPRNDAEFLKRSLGVMVAHMWLASYYIHGVGSDDPTPTHPPGPTRLMRSLERHVVDANHATWFVASSALCLHLQNRAPVLDTFGLGDFHTAKACVDRLVQEALRDPATSSARVQDDAVQDDAS